MIYTHNTNPILNHELGASLYNSYLSLTHHMDTRSPAGAPQSILSIEQINCFPWDDSLPGTSYAQHGRKGLAILLLRLSLQ